MFVHVGLPKTGTTYLQNRLWRNRATALSEFGLFVPGNTIEDHFQLAVHLQPQRYLDWVDPARASATDLIVSQVTKWPGTSLISHELLATATPAQADQLLAMLAGREIHVVVTVRDLARQIPSVWQENVKNQGTIGFDEFVSGLRTGRDVGPFWEFQDYVRVLDTWGASLPRERVHVVTVPRSGSVLWPRFVSALGADPDRLDVTMPPANSGLSSAQVELVRRMNADLQPADIDWWRYERAVKEMMIGTVMFASSSRTGRNLEPDDRRWAAEKSAEMIDAVRRSGYDVVGDLDDLVVSPDVASDASGAPSEDEVLAAARDTLVGMIKQWPLPSTRRSLAARVYTHIRARTRKAFDL